MTPVSDAMDGTLKAPRFAIIGDAFVDVSVGAYLLVLRSALAQC